MSIEVAPLLRQVSPRPALGALGVPPVKSALGAVDARRDGLADFGELSRAGASPSRYNSSSRDDALLVWLAGRSEKARKMELGAGSEEVGRRAERGGENSEVVARDDSADERVGAIDDVFAGLVVGV